MTRQIASSGGSLLLSARSISTEAESGKLKGLRDLPSFQEMTVRNLAPEEVDALITLIDQIAGWRNFQALSHSERRRFVLEDCRGVIPNVLLHLLNSDYVREKYREEYQKTNYLDVRDRHMVIAALLISNLGHDAPLSLISDIFERDFVAVLKGLSNRSGGLRLVRAVGSVAQTIPSIGARNLLKSVIEDREVVNTAIEILERMSGDSRRTDFQQHIFSQLMRYSILSATITDTDEVNRFFDHISKIRYFRDMPLFWLQWHMAMCEQRDWRNAQKYLDMGYTAAEAYEKRQDKEYNRKQLDDRKAKFLAARAIATERAGVELFRDLKEAIDITGRLMRESEVTHHPYETLLEIVTAVNERGKTLLEGQEPVINQCINILMELAKNKFGIVAAGYQRNQAIAIINKIESGL